jgi:hypothetical protein
MELHKFICIGCWVFDHPEHPKQLVSRVGDLTGAEEDRVTAMTNGVVATERWYECQTGPDSSG